MKFITQLYMRIWASLLLYAHLDIKKPVVRCETCPRWKYHATARPLFADTESENARTVSFPPVPLGVCRLSKPAIVHQGGIGFGLRLFHPGDWCPNHPLYKPAPASDLPSFAPPLNAVARNEDGTETEHAGFTRPPTFEEALRLARVLEDAKTEREQIALDGRKL